MKIVKLFGFLLLLTSCNQYLGTIEPDYIPQNEVEEVFLNKTRALGSDYDFKIGEVFYPDDKKFDLKEILDFKKIASIDKNSQFLILENEIYFKFKFSTKKVQWGFPIEVAMGFPSIGNFLVSHFSDRGISFQAVFGIPKFVEI